MQEIRVGMQGIMLGMCGVRGMQRMIGMQGIRVGMSGLMWECGESGWECRKYWWEKIK